MNLDLQDITFYVSNLKKDFEKKSMVINQCRKHNLKPVFVPTVQTDNEYISASLTRLKILRNSKANVPFALMSDSTIFNNNFEKEHQIPDDTDAIYLGISRFGLNTPGKIGYGKLDHFIVDHKTNDFMKLHNNLGAHCLVVISEKFRLAAIDSIIDALTNKSFFYPSSVALATLQSRMNVITPSRLMCHESSISGGDELSTNQSILPYTLTSGYTNLELQSQINKFLYTKQNDIEYYLFYDVFVHFDKEKITAVAPFYGDDFDLTSKYSQLILEVDNLKIQGEYIPCRLDSWEPTILIDFSHPELKSKISQNQFLDVKIQIEDKEQTFSIKTNTPSHNICMSVIVKDENKWLPFFLEYYLNIMKADHILVYDNNTKDKNKLHELLLPYIKQDQITLIPWHFRWRNRIDKKQIGQPPQEAHSLNKFGNCKWIGFFDVDEILRIPGQNLPSFLRKFDPNKLGGLSFGLRWAFYKGPKTLEQIENPLTEFIYTIKDELGRKRQKLIVSPFRCRYLRFHWLPDDEIELAIDDSDIFFHHYVVRENRFNEYKSKVGKIDRTVVNLYKDLERMKFLSDFLDESFEKAERKESKLTERSINIEGYLGTFTRHFYNNIGSLPGLNLLEIGLWRGASSCCFLDQNWIRATFIDNWSEFGGPKEECLRNIRSCIGGSRIKIIEHDCFSIDKSDLEKYHVYSYDGPHSFDDHYRAIINFYNHLHDIAIIIVDDWNRKHVRDATLKAIKDLEIPIFYEREIILNEEDLIDMPRHKGKDHWWDGIYVFAFNKNLPILEQ